jgi:hypothetical protein
MLIFDFQYFRAVSVATDFHPVDFHATPKA